AACFQSNDLGRGTVAVFGLQTRTRFEEPITTRGYVVPSGERLHGPSPHRESFPVADRPPRQRVIPVTDHFVHVLADRANGVLPRLWIIHVHGLLGVTAGIGASQKETGQTRNVIVVGVGKKNTFWEIDSVPEAAGDPFAGIEEYASRGVNKPARE